MCSCQSTYNALFELSGCLSCTEDVRVFQDDVMEACERISSRSECTSEDARIEVEEMLCDITQPVASLNCLNNEEISMSPITSVSSAAADLVSSSQKSVEYNYSTTSMYWSPVTQQKATGTAIRTKHWAAVNIVPRPTIPTNNPS